MKTRLCSIVGHKYTDWEYLEEHSCIQTRICQRCGHKKSRRAPHQFTEWEYMENDTSKEIRTCIRCGYKNIRETIEVQEEVQEKNYETSSRYLEPSFRPGAKSHHRSR